MTVGADFSEILRAISLPLRADFSEVYGLYAFVVPARGEFSEINRPESTCCVFGKRLF